MRASNTNFNKSKIRVPVLKAYFKVIKMNLPSFSIYICIFLALVIAFTKFGSTEISSNFEETKSDVAFFDYDGTPLTDGLKASLSQNAVFINIADDKEALSDALFYHDVSYIVRIPKGFTQAFLNGENADIYKTVGQDMNSSVSMDLLINRYLSAARLYNKNMPDISQRQLVKYVNDSISQKTAVTTKTYGSDENKTSAAAIYFTFLCYGIITLMFFGVSSIMMVFNKHDLKSRNLVSPLKPSSVSVQLFAGHLVYMLVVWVCGIALSLILCGTGIIGTGFALLCANLLCICLACLSLSFLIGSFVTNRSAQNGIANVLALGLSFFSGIFIPQEMLSGSVLAAAHFTPTYWYVKTVNDIGSLNSFNSESLSPVISSMLIQLGFAAAFFAVAMVVTRQKKSAVV